MAIQDKLLTWFAAHQRPLPWRKAYKPYEVWVSEIMLQQTQVETALPYYKRWLRAFPSVRSLAEADEKKVLKNWQGLGYYSRARNIHASAKRIMEHHGGSFPSDFAAIRALKGVGDYTAGAIASIAFNQDRPIVDGNVLRVLSRLYAIKDPIDIPKNKAVFWKLQEKLIPSGRARDFNQALMELGALVCVKNEPRCGECPVRAHCAAFKKGSADQYPVRARRKRTVKVEAAALALEKNGKYFIHRRPEGSVMGGLWEFPEWKNTTRPLAAKLGLKADKYRSLGTIKRNYTNHLETLHVYSAKTDGVPPKSPWPSAWVSKAEFGKYPFSSAHAKLAKLL